MSGRQDDVDVGISPEDMEILQNHPEFCLPSESLLDFEALVQDEGTDTMDDQQEDTSAAEISMVSILLLYSLSLFTWRP